MLQKTCPIAAGLQSASAQKAKEAAALYTILWLEGALSPSTIFIKIQRAGDHIFRPTPVQVPTRELRSNPAFRVPITFRFAKNMSILPSGASATS